MSDRGDDVGRERFEDLAAAYALGALTDEERWEFEAHLAEHPELLAEVEELGEAARLLALAPQEHEPSPELRRNLLERVGGVPDATFADRPRRRVGLEALLGPGGLAAAAAVVAVVVGLFVWNLSLQERNEALQADVQGLQSESEALQAEVEERRTYELQGSGAASEARGEVMTTGEGRAVLVAENLPPAPEGQVYEAWVVHDGVPEPAGLFEPRDGSAAATVEVPLEGAEAVAVTLEPAGGSPMPTSDPLLTAPLA